MATRTVSHLALCCLIAAIVLTNATSSRAAPADKAATVELMLSDLSPLLFGEAKLNKNGNGGPLRLRTSAGNKTYPKGIGMTPSGSSLWIPPPAGCTGFAATIGPDVTAQGGQMAGFMIYQQDGAGVQTPTNWGEMPSGSKEQVKSVPLRSDIAWLILDGHGSLADWANARFTGCSAATPTPTATRTPTATPTATATPPATATSLPTSTATPVASGFTHGIFEEGNLDVYDDPEAFRGTLLDIKARGFRALIVTNGNLGRNNGFLTVADQVGGIKVYLGAPELMPPTHEVYTSADATQIATTVSNQFKMHPSFAGYYLQDEPADDYADDLALLAQAFRTADPAHDIFIVNNAIDSRISTFSPQWMRPLVIDPYPFVLGQAACDLTTPTGPAAGFAYAPFIDELISRSGKPASMPFLMIGQAFSGGEWRAPSAEEIRAQYRVSREKGASAMFWFIWSSVPSEGLVGLKDRPLLLAEVTAIAQGTSTGPSCLSTATPPPATSTPIAPTATSTPVQPTATATQVTQSGSGVPSVPLNYAENVDQFWARHPANSVAPGYVSNLGNPGTVVSVNPSTIASALSGPCVTSECTLMLADGNYGPINLIARSNIHFRGVNRNGARLSQVMLANCSQSVTAAVGGSGSYTVLNEGLNNAEPWAIDCFANRHGNISFKNLTFDGHGQVMVWEDLDHRVVGAALWSRVMRDVWVEDVTVTGYLDGNAVHDGTIGGNFRVDNLLLRRIKWDTSLVSGPGTYAFFDGCQGCAILDSEMGYTRAGALTFYANDDATEDLLPQDGVWADNELRLANYIVMRGNHFWGDTNASLMTVQGRNALIENNVADAPTSDFYRVDTRRPFNHPAGLYVYKSMGHRVRNNQINNAFGYMRVDMPDQCFDVPSLTPDQCLQAGDLEVTGNHMTNKGRMLDSSGVVWTFGGDSNASTAAGWPSNFPKHAPILISGNN